jgi:hypothetical protein
VGNEEDEDMKEQREPRERAYQRDQPPRTLARLYISRDKMDGLVILTESPRGKSMVRRKVIRDPN